MEVSVTRWWWVRHAPVTVCEGRIYGAEDPPCDTDDTAAFEGLARHLPEDAILMTSDLQRTHQTAAAIAKAGLTLPEKVIEPAIREQNFGSWQGRTHAELEEDESHIGHHFWLCPAYHRAPEGESFADVIARVAPAVESFSDQHPNRDVVAVSHGGTIRAAIGLALGIDAEKALSFTIDNLSITRLDRIEFEDRRVWKPVMINRSPK